MVLAASPHSWPRRVLGGSGAFGRALSGRVLCGRIIIAMSSTRYSRDAVMQIFVWRCLRAACDGWWHVLYAQSVRMASDDAIITGHLRTGHGCILCLCGFHIFRLGV